MYDANMRGYWVRGTEGCSVLSLRFCCKSKVTPKFKKKFILRMHSPGSTGLHRARESALMSSPGDSKVGDQQITFC